MHSICTPDQREAFAYLQRLSSTLLAPDPDLATRLESLFAGETEEFGLDSAFCSHIDREAGTERFEVVHAPSSSIEPGQSEPLATTYCRETIDRPDGTLVISDAEAEGWAHDPAYEKCGFGSYVGTTVTVGGDLYGTLCYLSSEPRDEPITPEEAALVEMQGRFVSYQLEQWSEEPPHEAVGTVGQRSDVTDADIDAMMDALGTRERRVALLSLLAAASGERIGFVERRLDGDHVRTALYHTHLPRLEEAGYVTYDRDAGTVEKGPQFPVVEPLVRLLWEYAQEGDG